MKTYFRLLPFILGLFFLSACSSPLVLFATPTATITPTPEPTKTPTQVPSQTPTPTITYTPTPQALTNQYVREHCEELSKSGNSVTIEGRVFMPTNVIYGSGDWRGMYLSDFLLEDSPLLEVFIQLGEGPNTMNPLPAFFTEKDLLIRDLNGQAVLHGFMVAVTGRPRYKPDEPKRSCALWVDAVESKMPPEAVVPFETDIKNLLAQYTVGHGFQMAVVKKCSELAFQRQLVRLNVAVDFWNFPADCNMGICRIKIYDQTGSMFASFVQDEAPNSMKIAEGVWGPNSWRIFDEFGNESDKENLLLTGPLYSDLDGCRIFVYTVESEKPN